jgi:hypothetical protein
VAIGQSIVIVPATPIAEKNELKVNHDEPIALEDDHLKLPVPIVHSRVLT